jgi:hypothetical protein
LKYLMIVASVLLFLAVPSSAQEADLPQAAQISPELAEQLRAALALPPGSRIEIQFRTSDGGSVEVTETGSSVGAGARAVGDKLDSNFTGTAPAVGLGGGQSSTGGGATNDSKASALQIPPLPWANPLFWIGVLLLAGAGACAYLRLGVRIISIVGSAGLACLAAAFFPSLLIWAAAAAVLVFAWPYISSSIKAQKESVKSESYREALRAVVAGVEDPTLDKSVVTAVKSRISTQVDSRDRDVIRAIKLEDKIGKFAE